MFAVCINYIVISISSSEAKRRSDVDSSLMRDGVESSSRCSRVITVAPWDC